MTYFTFRRQTRPFAIQMVFGVIQYGMVQTVSYKCASTMVPSCGL